MNKLFSLTAILFLISSAAMATVGDDLKSDKGDGLLVVSKLICASGKLDAAKAKSIVGQKTNTWFVADIENYGGVLQKSGDSIVEVLAQDGTSSGLCDNSGKATFLFEILDKTK